MSTFPFPTGGSSGEAPPTDVVFSGRYLKSRSGTCTFHRRMYQLGRVEGRRLLLRHPFLRVLIGKFYRESSVARKRKEAPSSGGSEDGGPDGQRDPPVSGELLISYHNKPVLRGLTIFLDLLKQSTNGKDREPDNKRKKPSSTELDDTSHHGAQPDTLEELLYYLGY